MKGFPNQVANLPTLAGAIKVIADLIAAGKNPKDDGVYGEALIRTGVLGTGHTPIPVDKYLADQKAIPNRSNQSYRTRARGLRELFRVMGLISGAAGLTAAGNRIAALAGSPHNANALRVWRATILAITHDGGDGTSSHPYQVLLRLVAKKPGITRAKCALALEAKDDTEAELARIVSLSALSETDIIKKIGTTQSNWNNAKKILPHFAEQLGDVRKVGQQFYLTAVPGATQPTQTTQVTTQPTRRQPRSVTPQTIATERTESQWDEIIPSPDEPGLDAVTKQARKANITDRFNRHQGVVKAVATALADAGGELFENPFDCFARFTKEAILVEVKTLDGTDPDEVDRVRESLAQLLYYQAFATESLLQKRKVKKIACFEAKISDAHVAWLAASDIMTVWREGDEFNGNPAARTALSGYFGF